MKSSWITPITETIVALSFFLLFNYLGWKNTPGFYGVEPHPYFVIILLMATRYGSFAGLLSASVCSAALTGITYFFSNKPLSGDPYTIKTCVLFFLAGFVIGEIREGFIKKENKLGADVDREKLRSSKLNEENELIKKVNKEMEQRILGNVSTFATLYETSKQLQSFNIEEIYHSILQILIQHLKVEECSIYLLKSDLLLLKESTNPDRIQNDIYTLSDEGIVAASVREKRVFSVRDFLDNKQFSSLKSDGPIMSAPLIKTDGTVIGAISIDKMPFFQITGSVITVFTLLADWVSKDIENALYFQEAQKKNIVDEVLNVYTFDYFFHRLNQELYRSKRYAIPLSIILVKIKNFESVAVPIQLNFLKLIASILNTTLRFTDIVCRYKETVPFGAILTTTSKDQAQLATHRIQNAIHSFDIETLTDGKPLRIEFGIGTFNSTIEQTEQLIIQAEEDLLTWGQKSQLEV